IQNLNINNEKTSYVASQVFRKNLFGNSHPYGREVREEDANALEKVHLEDHFTRFFHTPMVFVSGKIDFENRERILETLRQLPAGKAPVARQHLVETRPVNQRIEKKDSVQSSVRTGRNAVLRIHADYVPILFVSHILGGYF